MNYLEGYIGISTNRYFCINTTICHTDTPYRQDPHLGEDKGGLSGPKKDTVFPHIVSAETILFWAWNSKGHST